MTSAKETFEKQDLLNIRFMWYYRMQAPMRRNHRMEKIREWYKFIVCQCVKAINDIQRKILRNLNLITHSSFRV